MVVTAVYNAHNINQQKELWHGSFAIAFLNLPWLIVSDLNTIISDTEHKGGQCDCYAPKATLFNNFIRSNQLYGLSFIRSTYTWCNGQTSLSRYWAKLNRFFANIAWISPLLHMLIGILQE